MTTTGATTPFLSTDRVERTFRGRAGSLDTVRAVDGLSMEIHEGRSVGIIGESGSGKSTLLRLLLGLESPDAGTVSFDGTDVSRLRGATLRTYRSSVQAVFQDSTAAFDPRQPLWDSVTEPLWAAERLSKAERRAAAARLLADLGLPPGSELRYPHALSGGERQRASIARALSAQPKVVMLDEPVTALDVSVRGSVINLLNRLAESRGLTYAVVSHDLTAVYYLTEYVYVMLHGRIVEEGPTLDVIHHPQHDYTRQLVRGVVDPLSQAGDERDELGVIS